MPPDQPAQSPRHGGSYAPMLLMLATQIAAFIPTLRIRKLQPVEALRAA